MRLVVQSIVDRGDTAGDAAVAGCKQQFDLGMLEERILRRRQPLVFGQAQRRQPVRIGGVALVGIVDELAEVASPRDAPNVDHGSRYVSIS